MGIGPGLEVLVLDRRMAPREIIRRSQFPRPPFAHEEREVLRVVVDLLDVHVERHSPKQLFQRLVSKAQIDRRVEKQFVALLFARGRMSDMTECTKRLEMVATITFSVESLRHEMQSAIQFVKATFAHLDSSSQRLQVDLVFGSSRILKAMRRELDEPVLKPLGQIPCSRNELVSLPIPSNDSLGLCTSGGRPYAKDFPEGVNSRHLRETIVEGPTSLFNQKTHINGRRDDILVPHGRSIRQSPHPPGTNICQTIQRRDLTEVDVLALHVPFDKRIAERVRQRIGDHSGESREHAPRQMEILGMIDAL